METQVESTMNKINDLIAAVTHARFQDKESSNYELSHLKESIALDYLTMKKYLAFEEDESAQESIFSSLICSALANHITFPKTVSELRKEISSELMREASNQEERREAVRISQSFVPSEHLDVEACLEVVSKKCRLKICIYDADNLLQIVRDRPLIINASNIRFKRDMIISYMRSSNQFIPLVKKDMMNLVQQWKLSHFDSNQTLALDAIEKSKNLARVEEDKTQEAPVEVSTLPGNEEKGVQTSLFDSNALPARKAHETELAHHESSMLRSQSECKIIGKAESVRVRVRVRVT